MKATVAVAVVFVDILEVLYNEAPKDTGQVEQPNPG